MSVLIQFLVNRENSKLNELDNKFNGNLSVIQLLDLISLCMFTPHICHIPTVLIYLLHTIYSSKYGAINYYIHVKVLTLKNAIGIGKDKSARYYFLLGKLIDIL